MIYMRATEVYEAEIMHPRIGGGSRIVTIGSSDISIPELVSKTEIKLNPISVNTVVQSYVSSTYCTYCYIAPKPKQKKPFYKGLKKYRDWR